MHFVAQGNFAELPRQTLHMEPEPNLLHCCSFGHLGHIADLIESFGGHSTKYDAGLSIYRGLADVVDGSFPFDSFLEVS